jgi:hypothetical protein
VQALAGWQLHARQAGAAQGTTNTHGSCRHAALKDVLQGHNLVLAQGQAALAPGSLAVRPAGAKG